MIETRAHRKKTKLPTPWTFNIPKRYKQNIIKTKLYRAKHISSNFKNEVTLIGNKCKSAGYPVSFVNTVIHELTTAQTNEDNKFIIPYCLKNESSSKQFIKKFDILTNDTFAAPIKWLTKKVKTLFRVKDKCLHQACRPVKFIKVFAQVVKLHRQNY